MASQKVLVIAALASLCACAVQAQDYPNRPLRILVGFTPCGGLTSQ